MNISDFGLKFIMNWEGTILKPYKDVAGIWTIGCGHVIKPGEKFTTITQEEAMELLRGDAKIAEDSVRKNVKVSITQSMFDALCSFTFNAGTGALSSSTLLKKLNASDYDGAAQEFLKWNKITDPKSKKLVENQGLLNRRISESKLFLKEGKPLEAQVQTIPVKITWNSDNIKLAQKNLKNEGLYTGSVDGIWGPKTEFAVNALLKSKGIVNDSPKNGVYQSEFNILIGGNI